MGRAAVANHAGTDAKAVVIIRHDVTIEDRNQRRKTVNRGVGLWRRNTCSRRQAAGHDPAHLVSATQFAVEKKRENGMSATHAPRGRSQPPSENNVQTKT
jgi:hypothetical protein